MARKSPAQLEREIEQLLYDPKRLRAVSRTVTQDKRAQIESQFPIGSYVRGTRFAFEDKIAKVTGYDLGDDEDAPLVKIRFLTPVDVGTQRVQTTALHDDEIAPVSREKLAVDKLLQRLHALEAKHRDASEDLRDAGRAADRVNDAEARGVFDAARKKAAERGWARAVRAEKALTSKMRDLVLKIRAIDPARVPWGWQNTR